ncbi:MAG: hypothetical protein KDB23_21325, partial [Planctomycetales bacterium]|nr:hypothetical protein [Planctomycetales bacterium]
MPRGIGTRGRRIAGFELRNGGRSRIAIPARRLLIQCCSLVILIGLVARPSFVRAVDLDEVESRSPARLSLLRWDNVEGAPYLLSGVTPKLDRKSRQHLVSLAPGQQTIIHLPTGSSLRAVCAQGKLKPNDLVFWVSIGSGLYRESLSAIGSADGSLIVNADDDRPAVVRVERPASASCALSVSLFVSRRMNGAERASYPCQLVGCEDGVPLCIDGELSLERYQRLSAGQTATLAVTAPARLRIVGRLMYSKLEAQSRQAFQIRLTSDRGDREILEVETIAERNHLVAWNDHPLRVSTEEVQYWD